MSVVWCTLLVECCLPQTLNRNNTYRLQPPASRHRWLTCPTVNRKCRGIFEVTHSLIKRFPSRLNSVKSWRALKRYKIFNAKHSKCKLGILCHGDSISASSNKVWKERWDAGTFPLVDCSLSLCRLWNLRGFHKIVTRSASYPWVVKYRISFSAHYTFDSDNFSHFNFASEVFCQKIYKPLRIKYNRVSCLLSRGREGRQRLEEGGREVNQRSRVRV